MTVFAPVVEVNPSAPVVLMKEVLNQIVDATATANYNVMYIEQFGAATSNTAAQNDAALVDAFVWLNAAPRRKLMAGAGSFLIGGPLPTITRSDVAFEGSGREVTEFQQAATSNNSNFLRIGNGVSTTARVFSGGFRFRHLNTGLGLAGYAVILDGAIDTVVEKWRADDVAGMIDIGPTLKSSRCRLREVRGSWRDPLQHRIGRFQRFTGLLIDDFVAYGDGTAYRTVPTFDFTTIGLCDTININKLTGWTRAGSRYGIYINADNGTFVNCWVNELVLDKTGNNGAAVWIEQTPACTATSENFWKIQNVFINDHRSDTGGDDSIGNGTGGRAVYISQTATTGFAMMRGIQFTQSLYTIRDTAAVTIINPAGTDVLDAVMFSNSIFREAIADAAPNVDAVFKIGANGVSIRGCTSGYAERTTIANVDNFVLITDADVNKILVAECRLYNIVGDLIKHPATYTALSEYRISRDNDYRGATELALPALVRPPIQPAVSGSVAHADLNRLAINAALLEAQATKRSLKLVGGSIPVLGHIELPVGGSGFVWENDLNTQLVLLSDQIQGFIRPTTANLDKYVTNATIENLKVYAEDNPETGLPFMAKSLRGWFRGCEINGLNIARYHGEQAAVLVVEDCRFQDTFYNTESTAGGTGAIRVTGGRNTLFVNTCGFSGDDGPQLTPAKSGIDANLDIDNVVFSGGWNSSHGRPFIILVDDGLTCSIKNSGYVGMRGICDFTDWNPNAESILIGHRGLSGSVSGVVMDNITLDERLRTTTVGVASGVKLQGAVENANVRVHINKPNRRLLTIENHPATGREPSRNYVEISASEAPATPDTSAISVQHGSLNTIVPRIVAPNAQHGVALLGGDRTSVVGGHVVGVAAGFSGVRDSGATRTDVARMQFSGTGTPYSFAATPATTGRVYDCDLGGLTASGSAPTLSNNRA